MMKKLRLILILVLLVVFIVSTSLLIRQWVDNKRNKDIYNDALNIAIGSAQAEEALEQLTVWIPEPVEDDGYIAGMEKINLDSLRERNEEVVGWIRIPNTNLDYPIMQGEDNEFYLNHAWNGDNSFSGSIFLENRSDPTFSQYNTIVYGHNMRNGSMFATLREYKKDKFRQKKPYVYIRTDEGVLRYEIFASFDAPLDSPVYGLSFNQTETKVKLLEFAKENSVIDTGIEPAITDRILTLSTCTNTGYSSRWVVLARLKMIEVPLSELPENY